MTMRIRVALIGLALAMPPTVFAGAVPHSYADAMAVWNHSKDTKAYQKYSGAFVKFNNHYRLDQKDGCYALDPAPVQLMLVITRPKHGKLGVVEQVYSDVDNAKAACFKNSYVGVKTKRPPFFPFVLQMGMG
jgi:hypothetical protein